MRGSRSGYGPLPPLKNSNLLILPKIPPPPVKNRHSYHSDPSHVFVVKKITSKINKTEIPEQLNNLLQSWKAIKR